MIYTLRDAAVEENYPTVSGGVKHDKYYPSVRFDVKQLPEISLWEVGGEYTLVLKVKQTSYEQQKSIDGKVVESAAFEIREVGAMNHEADTYGAEAKKKLGIK